MLHVLLDTSIYRGDRKRNKAGFRALSRLLRGSKVQLHIPYWVKREFLSQQRVDLEESLTSMLTNANRILRCFGHEKLETFAERTKTALDKIRPDSIELTAAEFNHWLATHKVLEHQVQSEHGKRVTEAYFHGAAPFSKAKQREDLPDSFIWQSMLDVAADHSPLHVVVNDNALKRAALNNRNMVAH